MTERTTEPRAISLVMPAYDEAAGIESGIAEARAALAGIPGDHEILIVDDGSTDQTAELAERSGARVIRHPRNRGYGASLKTAIAAARHDTIVMTDADGTYPLSRLPEMLARAEDYDMVVGARTGDDVAIPFARRWPKWVLRQLASYLAGQKIPDLNSGLRVLRRRDVQRFEHILPPGFSFTTTITLAFLCSDLLVDYLPIDYRKRVGQSKIRPTHALEFLVLILRTIVYFNPLRVFLPAGAVFFLGGIAKFIHDLVIGNLSETAVLGFLGGTLLWAVGLLADQISRVGLSRV